MTNLARSVQPNELHRVTTQFVDTEDRIRLSGELASGHTVILWLTRRLLDRLLPILANWLEHQTTDRINGTVVQRFAQSAASFALEPQAPVQTSVQSEMWLAQSIDVARDVEAIRLVFRNGSADSAQMTFDSTLLRQWLAILRGEFRKGDWQTTNWPVWMEQAHEPVVTNTTMFH